MDPDTLLPNGQPAYSAPIDATKNWWGSESTGYVNGKIWDKLDNNSLVAAEYMPVKINNQSLIYGKCAPGWFLDNNRCYKYMGAALPYKEADQFCKENGGFLAETKGTGTVEFLKYLLRLTMNVYDEKKRVWVYSEVTSGRCAAIEKNYVVEEYDCYNVLHPFLCEKDPYITAPDSSLYMLVIAIAAGVFGLAVIIIIILACMWCVKSKRRKREKFERQASIRSSLKGSTIKSRSTMSMLSEGHSKRRLDQLSLSSSKYMYDERSLGASQISLSGVTEDETTTDPREARRKLRQRAEIARGRRDEESPRYDRHDFQNGRAGGRKRREYSEDVSDDEPIARGRPESHHTNGGYKYSDESYDQTDRDSDDDCVNKPISDSEDEEDQRSSFTPVKFKPNVEKELDSIQMNPNGSIQFRRQDDSGSVDLSGRQLHRSMSSFSAHDSQQEKGSNSSSQGSGLDADNAPQPPPPLPLNIPAKPNTPTRPQPKPVPAPRPKPLPSARSFGSKENLGEMKLNNLSQDEASDYRGSRERLDNVFTGRKAPSRENLNTFNEPYKQSRDRSREDLTDTGLGVGVDLLPRQNKIVMEKDDGRDSPLHTSRENLLPKRKDSDSYRPPGLNRSRENIYKPDLYDHAANTREPLYPYQGTEPGIEYMGRQTPQNTDYGDGTGVDYLPRDTRTPMKSRFMMGQPPQSPDNQSPYSLHQPQDAGYQYSPSSYKPGHHDDSARYQPDPYKPRYPSSSASESMPYQPPSNSGIDYLPRNNYGPSSSPHDTSRSRENISR